MASHLYKTVRANLEDSSVVVSEERVEVNQRALIDKILARYASAGAVYRELLQNSNDADATIAEIFFTVNEDNSTVKSVKYRNNGMPFRPQDWERLQKIAEGNPDESKVGAFGVGAYTMFSICEEPIVLSGNQALAFVWKGDSLWTRTVENNNNPEDQKWTSFLMPSRDAYALPNLQEFGEFLCASLTFTKSLKEIRVYVNDIRRMTILKTLVQEPTPVKIPKSSTWWKSGGGALTMSPNGLFTLQDLLESIYHIQVTLDNETAAVTARYLSALTRTKIPTSMVSRMERVTKKKPPSKVEVQIFLNAGQQQLETNQRNKAYPIVQSFSPRMGQGRIFIGFRTSQTTGFAAHLAAPFVPTVEREAMDLQDRTLRLFNLELLEFSGILMRLTLEHGMTTLGVEFDKGAAERVKLEKQLMQEEEAKNKKQVATPPPETKDNEQTTGVEQTGSTDNDGSKSSTSSSVWGFAKFMAQGVKQTIVQVVNKVEEFVDNEVLHPKDARPLCPEENQAILLMQSFCPRQSTPDLLVGTALAQGFSRCFADQAPPVLTRTGVVPGDQARLPYTGMEFFCRDNVVRMIVYQNAEEYHSVVAQCKTLSIDDLSNKLKQDILEEAQLIRFLKWWARFCKIHQFPRDVGIDLKEKIRFFRDYKENDDVPTSFWLRDFLFYLDDTKIRTGFGFSIDTLPMPDSILPKSIQGVVSLRTLSDPVYQEWFEPLPIEIWIDFIGHHPCMTSGQPEHEKLRMQVLSTLGQEYSKRPNDEQPRFGNYCQEVLKNKRCIPFDSSEPTSYCADIPSNLYLASAELKAFDGIGKFHKVSDTLANVGIPDNFLVALGVRKSVAIDFLFANLDTLKWSSDPKPLVQYLRAATLTKQDIRKLRSTQYLPGERDVGRMFAPSELHLPDRELRGLFPFLTLMTWPSEDMITEHSPNGMFLVSLGMNTLPPLIQVLRYISSLSLDDDGNLLLLKCLDYVCKRLGSRGAYQAEYERIGRTERGNLKFLPCTIKSPFEDGKPKQGLYSTLTCCADERCAVMGFPVIDPSLGSTAKLYGSMFQCVAEPGLCSLIQKLHNLINGAKKLFKTSPTEDKEAVSENIVRAFSEIFHYLSSRTSEFTPSLLSSLENEEIIPCFVSGRVQWWRPSQVFFKGNKESDDNFTESLFQVVEFSPFLAAIGVKQEASTRDVFQRMIDNPQEVLASVRTEAKYRMILSRIAANPPFGQVTSAIRAAPFLLAYSVVGGDSDEKTKYELAKASDIYIIDNSFFGRMFPVKRCPHESDLEEFYSMIGAKYISTEVNKQFYVVGDLQKNTLVSTALVERIQERKPLLLSPSITSGSLVPNAEQVLHAKNLDVREASGLKAVYSLNKSVRSQHTTCCCQPGTFNKSYLHVTSDFDWFDVGCAIGELILERCQLEDAFFISSLLEAPLEQLRSRGFPVDRIIKPPEPEPASNTDSKSADASKVHRKPTPETAQGVPKTPKALAPILTAETTSSPPKPSADPQKRDSQEVQNSGPKQSPLPNTGASNSKGDDSMSRDNYAAILKQMYPDANETYIRNRLAANPTIEQVHSLAEEMATKGYPKDGEAQNQTGEDKTSRIEDPKASAFFGSKQLGKALNGLKKSSFGGSLGSTRLLKNQSEATGMSGPPNAQGNNGRENAATPEVEAMNHENMEKMLQHSVKESSKVDPNGVCSPETQMSLPEGLNRGSTCEVIPAQRLKPFTRVNKRGETHNGLRIFSSRKNPSSEEFLSAHFDAAESFAVVLERLCGVYDLPLTSVAIYHDPLGKTIAFNANRALHFNVHFFHALHDSRPQSHACYAYWFVTFAHELAHHLAPGHGKEHGFFTESYASLYLPKLARLIAEMQP